MSSVTTFNIRHCKKKWSFPWRCSSVNATKSAGNCGCGHIYWKNPSWKTSFFSFFVQREGPCSVLMQQGIKFTKF